MTQVQCTFKDSNSVALVGYVTIKLDYTLQNSAETTTWLPVYAKVPLVAGECTLDLEPSDLSGITYLIEVYQSQVVSVDDPDNPGETIDATVDTKIDEYRVIIPFSATPIQLESLTRKTGIDRDRTATMIPVVLRRMYSDPTFWSQIQSELFPHKGEWSSATTYRRGDVITYDGNTFLYYSNTPSSGVVPIAGAVWRLFAARGSDGTGTTGNDTPYSVAWDGQTDAPSRNAIYDIVQQLATVTQVNGLAPLVSPALSGIPTAPSPALSDNTSRIATTSFVQSLISAVTKAIVPVGTVSQYAGTSSPTGWVLCDGRVLDRTAFATLFAVIGTVYNTGGESGTQFRVPDLRGRVPVAPDNMGGTAANRIPTANALNVTGGAATVTLTVAQMPSHSHTPSSGFTHFTGATASGGGTLGAGTNYGNFTDTASSGGGGSHENCQPYQTLNFIIYTGV